MLDYENSLNPAQLDAVTCSDQSVLVVAGAGSGKTRTITYRLAWLAEHGVTPESILLLTFTRKAANEMLGRAATLLGQSVSGICGGTFHSFAFGALRRHAPAWLKGGSFTLMDPADVTQALRHCRETLKLGKRDSSFPKSQTIADILGKARNKELPVPEILRNDSFHLLPYAEDIERIGQAYAAYRREKSLLDYDDLLFELEDLLKNDSLAADAIRRNLGHILVDEYQDTNLVQARLVRLLAGADLEEGPGAKVMAVGDESQSIYAFRGANVRNILDFPRLFPQTRVITLEQNYRSTQPILNVANGILAHAAEAYKKKLYTKNGGGSEARLITTLSDASQAALVARRIEELLGSFRPHEIAVLFRSGYHSYLLENTLRKAGISFCKYGGLRFVEAAHIKDLLAFARLALNPRDFPAFARIAAMHKGIGPKTAERLHGLLLANDEKALARAAAKFPELARDLALVESLRQNNDDSGEFFQKLLEHYRPRMETLYPEDWPSRLAGLEEVIQMSAGYATPDLFIADLALESPPEDRTDQENSVTLSTVHSAKGLEWQAVLIIDAVEDRFPSRHAQARPEDFEEERRLFYVACTRAKQILEIYAPSALFNRATQGVVRALPSPFVRELAGGCLAEYAERPGGLLEKTGGSGAPVQACGSEKGAKTGYCRHKIFGRGKIVKKIDAEKVQVNFPGFGLKVILADYLMMEE